MGGFKARRLRYEKVREKAEEFRKKYVSPRDLVPVPVEDILELDLGILPCPKQGLIAEIDVDGFLSKDLKHLYVDEDIYNNPKQRNRLRFTYAHEIGHYVLHKEEIQSCQFRTEEDWIHFREDMSKDDWSWFEYQAYEFAGRLLVPVDQLKLELENKKDKIKLFRDTYGSDDDDLIIQAISRVICSKFGVSEGVIRRRIKSEKIWSGINLQ